MRHITHFLRLKIFQQIGFCSTKVRNSIVFLSSSTQVEEFLLQQSRVLVQRSMSRQNLERITILTPQKRFILHGDSGIVALNDKARILADSIPQEQKKRASFLIVASYWNLNRVQRSASIFKTTKYIALGYKYIQPTVHTHIFLL